MISYCIYYIPIILLFASMPGREIRMDQKICLCLASNAKNTHKIKPVMVLDPKILLQNWRNFAIYSLWHNACGYSATLTRYWIYYTCMHLQDIKHTGIHSPQKCLQFYCEVPVSSPYRFWYFCSNKSLVYCHRTTDDNSWFCIICALCS